MNERVNNAHDTFTMWMNFTIQFISVTDTINDSIDSSEQSSIWEIESQVNKYKQLRVWLNLYLYTKTNRNMMKSSVVMGQIRLNHFTTEHYNTSFNRVITSADELNSISNKQSNKVKFALWIILHFKKTVEDILLLDEIISKIFAPYLQKWWMIFASIQYFSKDFGFSLY